MGVNHALWKKMNERSGASCKSLAGQREVERALEDVEALVAVGQSPPSNARSEAYNAALSAAMTPENGGARIAGGRRRGLR